MSLLSLDGLPSCLSCVLPHRVGVLCSDMGMGKTYVTLSFLGGMMRAGTIQNALVVAPLSVLQSWEKEAKKILPKCTPKVKITVLSSEIARRTRLDMIDSIKRYVLRFWSSGFIESILSVSVQEG